MRKKNTIILRDTAGNPDRAEIPLTNLVLSVRTVSYGPSLIPLDLWPKREARGP